VFRGPCSPCSAAVFRGFRVFRGPCPFPLP